MAWVEVYLSRTGKLVMLDYALRGLYDEVLRRAMRQKMIEFAKRSVIENHHVDSRVKRL